MKNKFSGMILTAGFGLRMLPLTKDLPKALIEVNGITLLENSINFLKKIGCTQIIINTHYKYLKINSFIRKRKDKNNIILIHENKILDTGGGVKNAIPYFNNENIIVINSDIYWIKKNIKDFKVLKKKFLKNQDPHLLLAKKNNVYGLKNKKGDFILKNKKIKRFQNGSEILFYSGLQILKINIFDNFAMRKFSFNSIWDDLILKKQLNGDIMQSKLYHVGDLQGLNIARNLHT